MIGSVCTLFFSTGFIANLLSSLLYGILMFAALCLMTENILKEKWQEYLITGVIFFVVDFLREYLDFFGIIGLCELIGMVWVPYKCLDFSLMRSFGVFGVIIVASTGIACISRYLISL